jgi:AcrR family transcriptional regulator
VLENRIQRRKQKIGKQRQPLQERSRQRRAEILRTTAALLEQVGFDDLTTILIARELDISVGSLYHYFPNKQAILYAVGEQWLEEQTRALEEIAARPLESMSVEGFVDYAFDRMLRVYREQRGMLPLTQAMWAVPELRDLDDRHDELIIGHLADMFRRLGLAGSKPERERRARLMLEMTHALFLSIVEQAPARASRSLNDLKALGVALLAQAGN